MFRFFQRWRKDKTVELESSHQQLLYRIRQIRVERIGRVFSSDKALLGFQVTHKSIQEYNQYLKLLSEALQKQENLNPFLFRNIPTFIIAKDWFVKNGYYLNAENEISIYIERSIQVVKDYIGIELKTDEPSFRKKLHVGPVISEISKITEQLIAITAYEYSESVIRTQY